MIARRAVATLAAAACSLCGLPPRAPAAPPPEVLHLPLQTTVGGVLTTGVFIDGEPFRLIADTGSPYLVVPLDECASQPPRLSSYGCAEPGQFRASAYPTTTEQYGSGVLLGPGRMQWLSGDVSFGEPELQRAGDGRLSVAVRFRQAGRVGGELVFGGADRNVMYQSGGALLGLIREVNRDPGLSNYPVADLRPTALAQLKMTSFRLDAPGRMLTLSGAPLIGPTADALPLVDAREWGDGVDHACCRVDSDELVVDGGRPRRSTRPILCVFDSGLTGVVLSQSLVDELGLGAQVGPRPSSGGSSGGGGGDGVRSLQLALRTERGRKVTLRASAASSPLFYTQAIPLNWFRDRTNGPHVIALGQCALGMGVLTVDARQRRALWEQTASV